MRFPKKFEMFVDDILSLAKRTQEVEEAILHMQEKLGLEKLHISNKNSVSLIFLEQLDRSGGQLLVLPALQELLRREILIMLSEYFVGENQQPVKVGMGGVLFISSSAKIIDIAIALGLIEEKTP